MRGFAVFLWFLAFMAFCWVGAAAGEQDYTGSGLASGWVLILLGSGFLVWRRAT